MSLKKNVTPVSAPPELPFTRKNYILVGIGFGLILLGFILMASENFIDATKFSLSLYVSPFLIIGGFAEIIYAILVREKKNVNEEENTAG